MTTTMSTEATQMAGTETFGARIRARRIARGVTQEQLARAVDVTVRQMQRIERGETKMPRLQLAQGLATYFGESLDSLVPERAHDANLPVPHQGAPHGTSENTTARGATSPTQMPRADRHGA